MFQPAQADGSGRSAEPAVRRSRPQSMAPRRRESRLQKPRSGQGQAISGARRPRMPGYGQGCQAGTDAQRRRYASEQGPSPSRLSSGGRPPRLDRPAAASKAGQDGAGARRGRLHRRRVRDRRPAGAGPADRQQQRQPVRRLRRHLGRLVHCGAVRQRRQPRGDDAGRHAAGETAIQGHRHRRPAAPERHRVCPQGRADAVAGDAARAPDGHAARRRVGDGRCAGPRRGPALGRVHRCRDRDLPAQGAQ